MSSDWEAAAFGAHSSPAVVHQMLEQFCCLLLWGLLNDLRAAQTCLGFQGCFLAVVIGAE